MTSKSEKISYADALKFHGKPLLNEQEISLVPLLEKQKIKEPEGASLPHNIPMIKLEDTNLENPLALQLPEKIKNLSNNTANSSFLHKPPIQPPLLKPPAQVPVLRLSQTIHIQPSPRLRGALPTVYAEMMSGKTGVLSYTQLYNFYDYMDVVIMSFNKFCTAYADLAEYITCISNKYKEGGTTESLFQFEGLTATMKFTTTEISHSVPDVLELVKQINSMKGKKKDNVVEIFESVTKLMIGLLNELNADLSESITEHALFSIDNVRVNSITHIVTEDTPQSIMPIAVLWKGLTQKLVVLNMRFNLLHKDILRSAKYLRDSRGAKASLKTKSSSYPF